MNHASASFQLFRVGNIESAKIVPTIPRGRAKSTFNAYGQQGIGNPPSPQGLPNNPGSNVDTIDVRDRFADSIQVAAGDYHGCLLRRTNAVWCWGQNTFGQLGNRNFGPSSFLAGSVPDLLDAVEVVASGTHSCARRRGGQVQCWGLGALGNGSESPVSRPTDVSALTDASDLGAGPTHTCAVQTTGAVWCWGENDSGQLGDNTLTRALRPRQVVGLADAVEVAAGQQHTCARRTGGTVSCWGRNYYGQLGSGGGPDRLTPVPVPGLSGVVQIAAGAQGTCARMPDNTLRCWGQNRNAIFFPTATASEVPTSVTALR